MALAIMTHLPREQVQETHHSCVQRFTGSFHTANYNPEIIMERGEYEKYTSEPSIKVRPSEIKY